MKVVAANKVKLEHEIQLRLAEGLLNKYESHKAEYVCDNLFRAIKQERLRVRY